MALGLALVAAACTPSQVDAAADISITARMLHQDGRPLAATKVVLTQGFGRRLVHTGATPSPPHRSMANGQMS